MTIARLAVLLDWGADPFVLLEQARVAMRFASVAAFTDVVLAVDFTRTLESTATRLHAIDNEKVAAVSAPLERALQTRSVGRRAVIFETFPRATLDMRYRRIASPVDLPDLGFASKWSVPRDGAIDLKDASVWLVPDWTSERLIYPVKPIATTYDPLADLLMPTINPATAFAKRMRYSEAAIIACPPEEFDTVTKRFGVTRQRLFPMPTVTKVAMPRERLLVLTSEPSDTAAAVEAVTSDGTHSSPPRIVTIAEVAKHTPMRTLQIDLASKHREWREKHVRATIATANNLITNSSSIAVLGDPAPRAHAIANWVRQGRLVYFRTDLPLHAFKHWPSARPSLKAQIGEWTRPARSQRGRVQ
jgi:hypothetical protein